MKHLVESVSIESKVKDVIAEVLQIESSMIGDTFHADDSPYWDSLTHLSLIEKLEEEMSLFANSKIGAQVGLVIVGLIFLISGAHWLVTGAVSIARSYDVSEWLIGITIVALGTSLPEIVSTFIASFRGQHEMSLGNIYGSNIFNISLVIGTASTIKPLQMVEPIHPDLGILIFLTFLLVFLIRPKLKLTLTHGIILLVCYTCYITLKSLQII